VCVPNEAEDTKRPIKPVASIPKDEELPWEWNDEEQVIFREVVRIDVNDKDARDRVTEARVNGTPIAPIVLVGHKGWAGFAKHWLVKDELQSTETTANDENANAKDPSFLDQAMFLLMQESPSVATMLKEENHFEEDSLLLDLSQPHKIDVPRMIDDIRPEMVPVVK